MVFHKWWKSVQFARSYGSNHKNLGQIYRRLQNNPKIYYEPQLWTVGKQTSLNFIY